MKQTITENMNGTAVIVGASLSGLMAGIALAQENIQVTILDKVGENRPGGSGLRADGGTFGVSKTEKILKNLVSDGKSKVLLWSAIENRLRQEAKSDPRIRLQYHKRVLTVGQDEEAAWAVVEDGGMFKGDVLIGADGHGSRVRASVAPDHTEAEYAGYMAWITSIGEDELPAAMKPAGRSGKVDMFGADGGFKFGSVLETDGTGGQPVDRRVGCTWYDNTRSGLLRRLGCVEGSVVHRTLQGKEIPDEFLDVLADEVSGQFPEPWRTAALRSIRDRTVIGIPIKEYVPDRLARGRITIVGDAAHVPAPITASGFNESLQDVVTLGKCASKGIRGQKSAEALARYEALRLETVRRMVLSGRSYSRAYGRP
ncbi:NAD(P)/FAD-dependent oxidoreductase [Bhargavaea ullalensis]|uniref:2-polyprenyl-6-methoxyphenol hydroxylase-like FAD-dependent oxidoreductase n=1 Tax=Bhargavaea ullalensis TaxID=1265685 RepID=A0ABV2G812_9BACL